MKRILVIFLILGSCLYSFSENDKTPCKKKKQKEAEVIESNINGNGYEIEINFICGKKHNNPSFAIWTENMNEEFIQELFVTRSVATGVYPYGDQSSGKWEAGEKMYRATLPYFIYKRTINAEIPTSERPVIDAHTGATPKGNFILKTKTDIKTNEKFRLLIEINQAWDSNNYWHNAKYPNEKEYRNSCQPSLVYAVTIDPNNLMDEYTLNPIGHGHYSGKDGRLYTDLSTFTTAFEIVEIIRLTVK